MKKNDNAKTKDYVTFGIRGEQLVPTEITKLMNLKPTKSWKKGDVCQARYIKKDGTAETMNAKRPWGIWSLSSEDEIHSEKMEKHMQFIFDLLEPSKGAVQALLKDPSLRISISIWWEPEGGQGGFSLPASIVHKISEFCNEMDFYFC